MKPLKSASELLEYKDRVEKELAKNEEKIQVKVHLGTCGISSGANTTYDAFEKEIRALGLSNVVLSRASCIGHCGKEPTVTVLHPKLGKAIYHSMTEDKVNKVVKQHLIGNKEVHEWTLDLNSPRIRLQEIRILRNQDIDPYSIDEYIARGGYLALAKCITKLKPEEVLAEVKKAGLRGRGGAGFPAATKWGFVRAAEGKEKYVVCNGDEGDPGAYMNRAVLEGNPHSIIEGMAIGAFAIGNVKKGYAYIRAEYPLAIKTFQHALEQAREYGLLGKNVLGTDFEFDLEIFPGAGAFVCGEETALLTSIEGNRGTPRQRPPFPANEGLFGKPTTLNNVETWSNVPLIMHFGADWWSNVGSKTCKGTKTLCLVGKVKDTGLIEVPLGTTLGQIIYDLGGGIQNDKKFKGVQLGGPSGGVIPAAYLNTPVDFDSIPQTGAIMGSGGVVVMDEDSCMVDVAKYFLDFTKDESCGKCISCREGNPKMHDILAKITSGNATMDDLKVLEDLTDLVKNASICALGQTSPNPVLTTLKYFRSEYEAHILDKKCPAAVCQSLFKAPCQHICPAGLDVPGYISLIKEGQYEQAYRVIMQKIPLPLSVGRVCPAPCQKKCRRSQVDESLAIRHLKRFAADFAYEHELEYHPEVKAWKKEKVAVIGSGPAGLAAACSLAIEGYPVTIFEALPVPGGMLAVGIPEYRLPKKYLAREIQNITEIGIEINLNSRVDNIPALFDEGYRAVLIAIGAHVGNKMGIPGEDLIGVMDAVEFLRDVNLGESVRMGQKVAVVGGGNSAIDAARTAVRRGAREVHILYRRQKEDMPAEEEEISAAQQEGIYIHTLINPTRIVGENGRVVGIECLRQGLKEFDRSGRRSPESIPGSEFRFDVDTVIEAVGQAADTLKLCSDGVQRTKTGLIVADRRTLLAGEKGIFTAGDCYTGPATVIEAIASGQRAASYIKRFLKGEPLSSTTSGNKSKPAGYTHIEIPDKPPTEAETKERSRVDFREIPLREKRNTFNETVLSYSPEEAKTEASRCLRCDLDSEE
jgi:NADH-quinone oxidoreductase subunit F